MSFLFHLILLIFITFFVNAVQLDELLIPGETCSTSLCIKLEKRLFKKSKLSTYEWKKKKCYNKTYDILAESDLCHPQEAYPGCKHPLVKNGQLGGGRFNQFKENVKKISKLCENGIFYDIEIREHFVYGKPNEVDSLISKLSDKKTQNKRENTLQNMKKEELIKKIRQLEEKEQEPKKNIHEENLEYEFEKLKKQIIEKRTKELDEAKKLRKKRQKDLENAKKEERKLQEEFNKLIESQKKTQE